MEYLCFVIRNRERMLAVRGYNSDGSICQVYDRWVERFSGKHWDPRLFFHWRSNKHKLY